MLAKYRASSHLYRLGEDDMGGTLVTITNNEDVSLHGSESNLFQVKFGFRRLEDKRVCIALFGPDIEKIPNKDLRIWRGYKIDKPIFAQDDPAFERWVNQYLEGDWDVEDGPIPQIGRLVKLIRALTQETLGEPLFRFEENPLINYPVAENTDAYAQAHLELYCLIIDGLNKAALEKFSGYIGITLTDSSKTLNSIKEILPYYLVTKVHAPFKKCSDIRNKKHGVPSEGPKPFPAFDNFQRNLTEIATGLSELNQWLERELSADSKACLERVEAVAFYPKFIDPPKPESKLDEIRKSEGKTIHSVEFGRVKTHPEGHKSEGIVFHFTDGSSMDIKIGSNIRNLSDKIVGLKPDDLSVSLMISWVPPIRNK
ncbi:MAG TPA: hypothetical protein HA349_00025 [Methanotrichaceae archaeon]|nr:hypothetical protein [Methanotrichaceae archaeon]